MQSRIYKQDMEMFLKEQDREESECDLLTRDCTLQIILSAQNTLHAIP